MAFNNKKLFLIINTGYLGDVILTSKLSRDIKKEYPDSRLVFIVDTPYKEIAEGLPGVDEIICYDRKKCQNVFNFIKFWIEFPYKWKIDYAFIPHGSKTNRVFLAHSLGSKKLFVLSKFKYSNDCYQQSIKKSFHGKFAALTADMLSSITGKTTDEQDIEYIIPKDATEKMDKYFTEAGLKNNLVAINPQASDDWKCWDVNEVIDFVKMLIKDGKKPVLTGVLKDGLSYVRALDEQIGADNYINLMDKTSLPELGALYKKCLAVISVDTGSMHMACAVGTTTIALFFKNNQHLWGPLNNEKNPYIYAPEGASAKIVFEKLQNLLTQKHQTA